MQSTPCTRLLLCVLTSLVLHRANPGLADTKPPNIVYILLDDAGYGDLSCYGQKRFQTPHIDRLAKEGMQFLQHYAGSTVCAPTRCVLMTGYHTGHSYVRGNREVQPEGQAAMPAEIVTIPRLLKQAGYATGAFGKWGLGAPASPSDPARHFQMFFGYNCQRQAHTYYPDHLWKNDQRIPLDGKTYSATLIMDQALQFVRDHAQQPFFLYLPVTIPHAAMHAPESYVAPFRKKFSQFENTVGRYRGPAVRNPVAAFAGMMTLMDKGVGDLMTLLEERNLDSNTLVMLSSDNGPHKEGGHNPEFFNSNGPFRGHKRDLYEGGVRVPLIARWPAEIRPGSHSHHISAHCDMLPTFCELAGVNHPANIDGISLVPTLTGKGSQRSHDYLYWEFYERGGKRAVRFGNWKAVQLNLKHIDQQQGTELYDLSQDAAEKHNVAAQHPEIVRRARQHFLAAHTPSEFWQFGRGRKSKPKSKP